jgi:hypothetical protein
MQRPRKIWSVLSVLILTLSLLPAAPSSAEQHVRGDLLIQMPLLQLEEAKETYESEVEGEGEAGKGEVIAAKDVSTLSVTPASQSVPAAGGVTSPSPLQQ